MPTDVTTSKEAWVTHVTETRAKVWQDYKDDEARLNHVVLYLREDPKSLPGKELVPRAAYMFAGDFYAGPDAAMPIETFKEAWAQLITLTSIAGLGIATVIYCEIWVIEQRQDDKTPLPEDSKDDPRAKEYLVFRSEHLDYGADCWRALITRENDKRSLGPWEKLAGVPSGRMFSFLPRDTPPAMMRLAAREMLKRLDDRAPAGGDDAPERD